MPILRLVEQRTINKGEVIEVLKQANTLKDLPSLEEYDQYLDDLWTAGKYREFIVNYLLRHHYVRNLGWQGHQLQKPVLRYASFAKWQIGLCLSRSDLVRKHGCPAIIRQPIMRHRGQITQS